MSRQKKRTSSTTAYRGVLAEPLKPRYRRRLRRARRLRRPFSMNVNAPEAPIPSVPNIPPPILSKPSLVPSWRAEYDEKLPLLLDHFGISKNDQERWYKLALCLAVAHVPGFQEKLRRKGGRPPAMTSAEEAKLYANYCELRKSGQSDRNAARLLANHLRKAGNPKISGPSVLRRMQRYAQKIQKAAADMQRLNNLVILTQNFAR